MKVAVCEAPCLMGPRGPEWRALAAAIASAGVELAVLNELPFGPWLPLAPEYDEAVAAASVAMHEDALDTFSALNAPIVVASRPVPAGARLANEAFAWLEGSCVPLHQKQYFPSEPGFYESAWFHAAVPGFSPRSLGIATVGAQMCTELMFNEWARPYGRQGAQIIVAPRASGVSVVKWRAALAMAAAVSGCYVLSSNRVGSEGGLTFGGRGFAYAPGGELIAETSPANPVAVVDVDLALVAGAQADWPCYVPELAS